jgi:hypothetical protein
LGLQLPLALVRQQNLRPPTNRSIVVSVSAFNPTNADENPLFFRSIVPYRSLLPDDFFSSLWYSFSTLSIEGFPFKVFLPLARVDCDLEIVFLCPIPQSSIEGDSKYFVRSIYTHFLLGDSASGSSVVGGSGGGVDGA